MSGNINSHKWSSENNRYTYLHFGGVGIGFEAKTPVAFVGLKAPQYPDEFQKLLLTAYDPNQQEPPFYSTHSQELPEASLSVASGRPRYWYSGSDAKREYMVVCNVKNSRWHLDNNYAIEDCIFVNGEAIYSFYGRIIMSAAIIEDPLEGDCVFCVSCAQYHSSTRYGSYYGFQQCWPIQAHIISLRNKSVVRSKTFYPADLGLPPFVQDQVVEVKAPVTLVGHASHTPDGTSCHIPLVWSNPFDGGTFYSLKGHVYVLSSDFTGNIISPSSGPGIVKVTWHSKTTAEPNSDVEEYDSGEPGAPSGFSHWNIVRNRSTSHSSVRAYSGGAKYVAFSLRDDESPYDVIYEATVSGSETFDSTYSTNYAFSGDDQWSYSSEGEHPVITTYSPSTERSLTSNVHATDSGSTNVHFLTTLTIWDGVKIEMHREDRVGATSGTLDKIHTDVSAGAMTFVSASNGSGSDPVSQSGSVTRTVKSNYSVSSYSRTQIVSVGRTFTYFDPKAKVAICLCTQTVSVDDYGDKSSSFTQDYVTVEHAGYPFNTTETVIGTSSSDTPAYLSSLTYTTTHWVELIIGSEVIKLSEVDPDVRIVRNESHAANHAWTEFVVGSSASTVGEKSGIYYTYFTGSNGVGAGSTYLWDMHSVKMGDSTFIAIPNTKLKYWVPENDQDKTFFIRIKPSKAQDSSELAPPLSGATTIQSVYPVVE